MKALPGAWVLCQQLTVELGKQCPRPLHGWWLTAGPPTAWLSVTI